MNPKPRDLAQMTLGILFIAGLIAASFWILRPFLPAIIWATMVVVATWPVMRALQARLWGRRSLAVAVMTLMLLLVLIVPLSLAIATLVDNADRIVDWEVYDGFDGPITAPHGNLVAIEEPGFPANKPMWRYVTPGMVTQYQIPELPEAAGSAGLSAGPMYLTVIPFYVQGQFDFGEFTYDELSQFRWKAWAVHTTVFLP